MRQNATMNRIAFFLTTAIAAACLFATTPAEAGNKKDGWLTHFNEGIKQSKNYEAQAKQIKKQLDKIGEDVGKILQDLGLLGKNKITFKKPKAYGRYVYNTKTGKGKITKLPTFQVALSCKREGYRPTRLGFQNADTTYKTWKSGGNSTKSAQVTALPYPANGKALMKKLAKIAKTKCAKPGKRYWGKSPGVAGKGYKVGVVTGSYIVEGNCHKHKFALGKTNYRTAGTWNGGANFFLLCKK